MSNILHTARIDTMYVDVMLLCYDENQMMVNFKPGD